MEVLKSDSVGKPIHKQVLIVMNQLTFEDLEAEDKMNGELSRYTLRALKQGNLKVQVGHLDPLNRLIAIAYPRHLEKMESDERAKQFIIRNK